MIAPDWWVSITVAFVGGLLIGWHLRKDVTAWQARRQDGAQ